jgi:hypothetical protein
MNQALNWKWIYLIYTLRLHVKSVCKTVWPVSIYTVLIERSIKKYIYIYIYIVEIQIGNVLQINECERKLRLYIIIIYKDSLIFYVNFSYNLIPIWYKSSRQRVSAFYLVHTCVFLYM